MNIAVWVQGRFVGISTFSGPRERWDDINFVRYAFKSFDAHNKVKHKEVIMSPVTERTKNEEV